jgi:DNA-binding XRE family transcriptional regulator
MNNPLYQWRTRDKKKKIPASFIGNKIGVTPQTVYYWEKGRVRPREPHWREIARILNRSPAGLIKRWSAWHESIGNVREAAELMTLAEHFGKDRITFSIGSRKQPA